MISDGHKVVLFDELEALLLLPPIRLDKVIRTELDIFRPEFGKIVRLLKRLHAANTIVVYGVLFELVDTFPKYRRNLLLRSLNGNLRHLLLRENVLNLAHVCIFIVQLPR